MVADFEKKQKRESIGALFKTMAVLFLILAVFLIFENIKLYQKKKQLTAEIQNYTDQIKKIQDSNQNLKGEIANSGKTAYIVKWARGEGDMQLPGEKVISFIVQKPITPKPQPANSWTSALNNFWNNVKDFFK